MALPPLNAGVWFLSVVRCTRYICIVNFARIPPLMKLTTMATDSLLKVALNTLYHKHHLYCSSVVVVIPRGLSIRSSCLFHMILILNLVLIIILYLIVHSSIPHFNVSSIHQNDQRCSSSVVLSRGQHASCKYLVSKSEHRYAIDRYFYYSSYRMNNSFCMSGVTKNPHRIL